MDPKHPTNQADPDLPEGFTQDAPSPEELPLDEGVPLHDWEIPTDPSDIIL